MRKQIIHPIIIMKSSGNKQITTVKLKITVISFHIRRILTMLQLYKI